MKKREFLKSMLGIGGAVIAAPALALLKSEKPIIGIDWGKGDSTVISGGQDFLKGDIIHVQNEGYLTITDVSSSTFTVETWMISDFRQKAPKVTKNIIKPRQDYWNQGRRW